MNGAQQGEHRKGGIPRGLGQTGPVLFSYGFRPFFFGAALWAIIGMAVWIAALAGRAEVAVAYGSVAWHAHEMLFGFAAAVLTGYLMTSVPNWSGHFPVSGWPLALLFAWWCAGRAALAMSDVMGVAPAIALDATFLPVVALLCGREIVSGHKWKDLRLVGILAALSIANIAFHAAVLTGTETGPSSRLAVALYTALITMVGGRMVPSFTRSALKARGGGPLPAPFGAVDRLAIALTLPALAGWVLLPESRLTAVLALMAATAQVTRLARWHGWRGGSEPIVVALHAAYVFIPLGLGGIALAALGYAPENAALHGLTVGAIGGMMLAVMMRTTRGHTGKPVRGSWVSALASGTLFAAALLRILAGLLPDHASLCYTLAGLGWVFAFGLFVIEYGPMLAFARRTPRHPALDQPSAPTRINMR